MNRIGIAADNDCIVARARQNRGALDGVIVNVIIAFTKINKVVIAIIRISVDSQRIIAAAADNRTCAVFQRNGIIAVANIHITRAAHNKIVAAAANNGVRAGVCVNSVIAFADADNIASGTTRDRYEIRAVARVNRITAAACFNADIIIAVARLNQSAVAAGDNRIIACARQNAWALDVVIVNIIIAIAQNKDIVIAVIRISCHVDKIIAAAANYCRVGIFQRNWIIAIANIHIARAAYYKIIAAAANNGICAGVCVNGVIAFADADNIAAGTARDRHEIRAVARVNRITAAACFNADIIIAVARLNQSAVAAGDNRIIACARQNAWALDVVIVNIIIAIAQNKDIVIAVIRISCHVDKIIAAAANNRTCAIFQRNWIIAIADADITRSTRDNIVAIARSNSICAISGVNCIIARVDRDNISARIGRHFNKIITRTGINRWIAIINNVDIVIAVARVNRSAIAAGDNCIVARARNNRWALNIIIANVVVTAGNADNVVVAIVRIIVDNQSIVAVARYERTFVAIFPINIIVAAAEADVTAADCNIASALAGSFNCICTQAAVNGIIARAYVDNISVRIALDRNKIVAIARVNRSAAFAGDCDIVVAVARVNRRGIAAADNCIVARAGYNRWTLNVIIVNVIITVAQIKIIVVAVIRISCHVDNISAAAANNRRVTIF